MVACRFAMVGLFGKVVVRVWVWFFRVVRVVLMVWRVVRSDDNRYPCMLVFMCVVRVVRVFFMRCMVCCCDGVYGVRVVIFCLSAWIAVRRVFICLLYCVFWLVASWVYRSGRRWLRRMEMVWGWSLWMAMWKGVICLLLGWLICVYLVGRSVMRWRYVSMKGALLFLVAICRRVLFVLSSSSSLSWVLIWCGGMVGFWWVFFRNCRYAWRALWPSFLWAMSMRPSESSFSMASLIVSLYSLMSSESISVEVMPRVGMLCMRVARVVRLGCW